MCLIGEGRASTCDSVSSLAAFNIILVWCCLLELSAKAFLSLKKNNDRELNSSKKRNYVELIDNKVLQQRLMKNYNERVTN